MEVAEPEPEPQAPEPPTLPVDLLLDIIARCDDDAKTVVRCGLVCKALRGAMGDPSFHARLGRRGGFDPGLLAAVSYRLSVQGTAIRDDPIVVQPSGRLPRFDTNLLRTFDPAACSCDGLLVLRDREKEERLATPTAFPLWLHVCNTITGHVTSLPSTTIGLRTRGMYQPALLSVSDDTIRSFKLLVMWRKLNGGGMFTQTFSSQEGEWGAARKIHIRNLPPGVQLGLCEASSTAPAVMGRRVYWLCHTDTDTRVLILCVRAESTRATLIKLPQELFTRMRSPSYRWTGKFMLAATAATAEGERQLNLVAAEPFGISMWTIHPEEGSTSIVWSRKEVILRQEIDWPITTSVLHENQAIWFSMFGERSGTVLFWMQTGEANQAILVQLNLVTRKTLVLWRGSELCCNYYTAANAILHETTLISVLKSF